MSHHLGGIVLAVLGALGGLSLAFSHRFNQWRARLKPIPVTDSNRAMRERRANVVKAMDATTVAYALGPYDAELRGLQHWVDRLAENDRKKGARR